MRINTANISYLSAAVGLVVFGLLAPVIEAAPVSVATIPGLVSSADVIVVGTVTSVQVSGPAVTGELVLSVDIVLKGSYNQGLLSLSYSAKSMGTEQAMIGKQILAFGKLSGDGRSYDLVPIVSGTEVLLSDEILETGSPANVSALAITSQDTPLQKVIKEFGLIQIGSRTTNAAPYLSSLPSARVEPDLTRAVFRAIQSSGAAANVALGAAGLVAMGDINGLEAADSLDIQNHPELASIISSIESSYTDVSQDGLQILSEWLGSSMPAVKREAAAGALARVHTPNAIMQLGNALNDSDFEVRWRAIGGLSLFANNVPVGGVSPAAGISPFRTADTIKFSAFDRNVIKTNEDQYLTFWRQWWNQNQGQIQTIAAQAQ